MSNVNDKIFLKVKKSNNEVKDVAIYKRKSSNANSKPIRKKYSTTFSQIYFNFEQEKVNLAKDSLFIFSKENMFRKKFQSILSSRQYIRLINTTIILNSIFLIFETINEMEMLNFISNIIFTGILAIDCLMKIIAYGFVLEEYTYLRDGWNWLDFIIVVSGLASLTSNLNANQLPFRALRLLRPLKLISLLPNIKHFLSILLSSLIDLGTVFLMILFFILIFAILGLSLWNDRYDFLCRTSTYPINGVLQIDPNFPGTLCGGEVTCNNNLTLCLSARDFIYSREYFFNPRFNPDDDLYEQQLNYGITNFNNILNAIFVVFQTTTIKGWTEIMYIYMNGYNYFVSMIYFCLCVIVNHYFLLNLIVAMLLYNFERNRSLEEIKIEEVEHMNSKENEFKLRRRSSPSLAKRKSTNNFENIKQNVLKEILLKKKYRRKYAPLQDISTFGSKEPKNLRSLLDIFSVTRCFENPKRTSHYHRKFCFAYCCFYIYKQPILQYFFYTCIVANTIALLFNRQDQNQIEYKNLEILNIFFVSVFTFEVFILLIGIGLYNFFKDFFNIWDFFVVLLSLIEIIILRNLLTLNYSVSSTAGIFRMLRILRIFKLFRSWQGFRVIIASVKETLTRMSNYLILFAIFIYIYTILGCIFFKDSLRFDLITNKFSLNGLTSSTNFDDFSSALVSVFQVLIGDNWFQLYFDCYRSSANSLGETIFYFITLVLLGHILMLNIFLAYIIDNFESAGNFLKKNITVKTYIESVIYHCSKKHEFDRVDYNSKNNMMRVSVFNYYLQKLENKKLLSEGHFIIAAKYELDFLLFKRKKTELYDESNFKTGEKNEKIIFFDELFLNEKNIKKNDFDPDEIEYYDFGIECDTKIKDNSELIKMIDLNFESIKSSGTYHNQERNLSLNASQDVGKYINEDDEKLNKKLTIVHEKTVEEISQCQLEKLDDNVNINNQINIVILPEENFYQSNINVNEENMPKSLIHSVETERSLIYTNSNNESGSEIKPVKNDPNEPENYSFDVDNFTKSINENKAVNRNNRLSIGQGILRSSSRKYKNSHVDDETNTKAKNSVNRHFENEKPRNSKSFNNNYIYNYKGIRNNISEDDSSSNKQKDKKIIFISDNQSEAEFRLKKNCKTYEERNKIILEEFVSNLENNNRYEEGDSDSFIESNSSPSFGVEHDECQNISNHKIQDEYFRNSLKISKKELPEGFQKSIAEPVIPGPSNKNTLKSFKQRISVLSQEETEDDESTINKLFNKLYFHMRTSSLLIFPKYSSFRKFLERSIESKIFEYFLTVIILGNCVIICLDTPLINPDQSYAIILKYLNYTFGVVFIIEAVLKIIAYGLFFRSDFEIEIPKSMKTASFIEDARKILIKSNSSLSVAQKPNFSDKAKLSAIKESIKKIEKQTAYLRNITNIIDFFVVIVTLIDLMGFKSIGYLKTLRALRCLRPIRLLTKSKNLKIMISCLVKSIPAMANVLFASGVFVLMYAILGVSLFKLNLNFYCSSPNFYTINDCIQNGGMWIYNYENFSNILFALKTLFELMMTQEWIKIMNVASQNVSKWVYLYYVPFVIISYFFILNLLVTVVIHKFKVLKNKDEHSAILTEEEREWIKVQKVMMKYRPIPKLKIIENKGCIGLLHRIVTSKKFDNTIMIMILLSLISLIMQVNGHDNEYDLILDSINYFFTFLFNVEITLKIFVYGKIYFKNGWNIFDFTIIIFCDIMAVLSIISLFFTFHNLTLSAFPILIRSLRFLRALRLITIYSKFRAVVDTMMYIVPTIFNLGIIYLVLIIIYGCIGMNIFGTLPYRENIDSLNNFKNFLSSALVLFRVTTGEKWNLIMNELSYHNCSYNYPDVSTDYYCLKYNHTCYSYEDLNYTLIMDGGYSCGSDFSYFYFISFMILGPVFILNLCVVTVIEGFSESMNENSGLLSQEYMDNLVSVWMNYDPDCQKIVRPHEFVLILKEMLPPFGFNYDRFIISDPSKIWAHRQKLLKFRKVLEENLSFSLKEKNGSDFEYQDENFKNMSLDDDLKNFYLSKNLKFNTTDLEVLRIMSKFNFSASENILINKNCQSYTFLNLQKKSVKHSTLIENDKGLYINFADACLGLSRFVVSKNNSISFDKFRENIVGDYTKKILGRNHLPSEMAMCIDEKEKPKRVSESLSLRIISKVKSLFVKRLEKVREKISARNKMNNDNQYFNDGNFDENVNKSCEMNPEFLNHRFNSKLFDDIIEEEKFETDTKLIIRDELPIIIKSDSNVSEASSVLRRNRNMAVNTNTQPKILNNMFYDFKDIGELFEVQNDSKMDNIKNEIDAYLESNRNSPRDN